MRTFFECNDGVARRKTCFPVLFGNPSRRYLWKSKTNQANQQTKLFIVDQNDAMCMSEPWNHPDIFQSIFNLVSCTDFLDVCTIWEYNLCMEVCEIFVGMLTYTCPSTQKKVRGYPYVFSSHFTFSLRMVSSHSS